MVKVIQILAIGLLSVAGLSAAEAGVKKRAALELHFSGVSAFADSENGRYLDEILANPASREVWSKVVNSLSTRLTDRLQVEGDRRVDVETSLDVLITDLLSVESCLRIDTGESGASEITLAINLEGQPIRIWDSTIRLVAEAASNGGLKSFNSGIAEGWEATLAHSSGVVQSVQIQNWMILSWFSAGKPSLGNILERLVLTGSPSLAASEGSLLSGCVDLEWVAEGAGISERVLGPLNRWPKVAFSIGPEGGHLKTEATIHLGEPYEFRTPLWHYPIENIYDPIISFAAIRGIGPWLEGFEAVKQFSLDPTPDQLSAWSDLGPVAYMSHVAFPMNNATNILANAGEVIDREYAEALTKHTMGEIRWLPDNGKLIWQNLIPLLYPYAEAVTESSGQFVKLGLFPLRRKGDLAAPPAGLFAELAGEPSVIYYQWEVTEPRLTQWRAILNHFEPVRYSYLVASGVKRPKFRKFSTSDYWLGEIGSHLGNAVTKLVQESPTALKFTRRSHLGLTALELVKITRSLEEKGYFGEEPPPASKNGKSRGISLPVPGLPPPP